LETGKVPVVNIVKDFLQAFQLWGRLLELLEVGDNLGKEVEEIYCQLGPYDGETQKPLLNFSRTFSR
jgi:hypothetical protein